MTEAQARRDFGDQLVNRARRRHWTQTQYGARVAYDQKLDGDYEFDDGSFWCRCRHGHTGAMCSHVLVLLLDPRVPMKIET